MKLLKKFIQVCKEFKQICSQNKSQIMTFFKLQALMFLAMLIGTCLGIYQMIEDGSMSSLFVGVNADVRVHVHVQHITIGIWIVGAFLTSVFFAMYRIVQKNR